MRLVFFGSDGFGLASLRALLDAGLAPSLVVTQPPRRRRRGGRPEPTQVHAAARDAEIEVATPDRVNAPESLARLEAVDADVFAVAQYGQILSRALLAIPKEGTFNVHASLLPRWRGATPIEAALLAGDRETGVTIQRTVFELDAGPVLARAVVPVEPDDDAGSLAARLAPLGGRLLVDVLRRIEAGDPPREEPQDDARATVCRRLRKEDARIDWTRPAAEIERQVRAFRPKPGARTELRRDPPLPLAVVRADVAEGRGEPGVVEAVHADAFDVAAGEGLLRVREVAPASKARMDARAFVNGYRLRPGELFT